MKVMMIPPEWLHVIVLILLVYFVADFSLSFKTALDLRDVIIAMERFRDEMERMEKRMDVMIDKEELPKLLKGVSSLSLALAMMGEQGVEVSPEASYVISRILDAIATMAV